jgi:hypothetical protein
MVGGWWRFVGGYLFFVVSCAIDEQTTNNKK